MINVIHPISEPSEGLIENSADKTSVEQFQFFHADDGKPLATPWQVALSRSLMLRKYAISAGIIVDCACGSGIQIAAYSEILNRPIVGVELNLDRARASAVNFRTIFTERGNSSLNRLKSSRIIVGDGRNGEEIMKILSEEFEDGDIQQVAFLHLDPARPRNSRAHSLAEMTPRLDEVFAGWKTHLVNHENGPAILLDLSPRLSQTQMLEVENLVDHFWPNISKTWTWTSRGKGRVDRLALWIGQIADPLHKRRFVRIPPNPKDASYELLGGKAIQDSANAIKIVDRVPKRGEYASLIDSALVESEMADDWLTSLQINLDYEWINTLGRRPIIFHDKPLENMPHESQYLVQCTGKITELIHEELNLQTIDSFVEICLKNDVKKLTIRASLSPDLQPKLQGSFDRQLARRGGHRDAFLISQPKKSIFLLCIV